MPIGAHMNAPAFPPDTITCPGCGQLFTISGDGKDQIVVGLIDDWNKDAAALEALGRQVAVVGDVDRRARIGRNLLAMAAMGGAMPIGFGVPSPYQDMLLAEERLARQGIDLGPHLRFGDLAVLKKRLSHLEARHPPPDPPASPRSRSLAEKKARRAKRKQRRNR